MMNPKKGALKWLEGLENPQLIKDTRKDAFITEIGDQTVDTVKTVDMGWETAILRKNPVNPITVVQYHENRDNALKGHNEWVSVLKEKPTIELERADDPLSWFFGIDKANPNKSLKKGIDETNKEM